MSNSITEIPQEMSHIHAEWASEETVLSQRLGKQQLRRYRATQEDSDIPILYLNTTVERVIAFTTREESGGIDDGSNSDAVDDLYLVKWKGHPYSDCTWETINDIKSDKEIERYHRRKAKRSDQSWQYPAPESFQKMLEGEERKDGNTRVLMPHQLSGVNWLVSSWYGRQNTILADEVWQP